MMIDTLKEQIEDTIFWIDHLENLPRMYVFARRDTLSEEQAKPIAISAFKTMLQDLKSALVEIKAEHLETGS